jgi:hypothetical protein
VIRPRLTGGQVVNYLASGANCRSAGTYVNYFRVAGAIKPSGFESPSMANPREGLRMTHLVDPGDGAD